MSELLDLPDEILSLIFEMLKIDSRRPFQGATTDKSSLSSLMRVHRRLSPLASRIIMRDVKLDIVTREKKKGDYRDGFPYGQLMDSLTSKPVLAAYVRNVDLEWDSPREYKAQAPENDDGLANKKTNELLALLPNIEYLRVQTNPDCLPFTPDFLARNRAVKLRKLRLPWLGVSLNDVVAYLAIPNLDNLLVDYPSRKQILQPDILRSREGLPRLTLSQLYLGTGNRRISELSTFLTLFSDIKVLEMGIPLQDTEEHTNQLPISESELGLSPGGIAKMLRPFQDSLVELWLCNDFSHAIEAPHDGTRMDLSSSPSLKKLTLPPSCLFPSKAPNAARGGVWRLLPPKIESLKIWFSYAENFLYSPEELKTSFTEDGDFNPQAVPMNATRYTWLEEIIERKFSHFHNLSEIDIEEKRIRVFGARYIDSLRVRRWKLPTALGRACSEAGVDLKVLVRIPKRRLPQGYCHGTTDEEDGEDEF